MPEILEPPISVGCEPTEDGWSCRVRVGDDTGATEHVVAVDRDALATLAPTGTTPEELVLRSFQFLLEREPRESVMRRFDLPLISRYFSDYAAEIGRRLGR